MLSSLFEMLGTIFVLEVFGFIIWGVICGAICYNINRSKGYPDYASIRGLPGAYVFGLIWIIITAFRTPVSAGGKVPPEYDMPLWEFVILMSLGVVLLIISLALFWMGDINIFLGAGVFYLAVFLLMILYSRI